MDGEKNVSPKLKWNEMFLRLRYVIYVNVAGTKDSEEIAMWPSERWHPCLVDLYSAVPVNESGQSQHMQWDWYVSYAPY